MSLRGPVSLDPGAAGRFRQTAQAQRAAGAVRVYEQVHGYGQLGHDLVQVGDFIPLFPHRPMRWVPGQANNGGKAAKPQKTLLLQFFIRLHDPVIHLDSFPYSSHATIDQAGDFGKIFDVIVIRFIIGQLV